MLDCFRRPARAEDRPTPADAQALGALGIDLRLDEARLAADRGGARYWIVPERDGAIAVVELRENGATAGVTPPDALAEIGAAVITGIHRGRWRYVVLVADGVARVRAGSVEEAVTDNLAVLDLPDRERLVELRGAAGSRTVDLGPSEWDRLTAAGPGG